MNDSHVDYVLKEAGELSLVQWEGTPADGAPEPGEETLFKKKAWRTNVAGGARRVRTGDPLPGT